MDLSELLLLHFPEQKWNRLVLDSLQFFIFYFIFLFIIQMTYFIVFFMPWMTAIFNRNLLRSVRWDRLYFILKQWMVYYLACLQFAIVRHTAWEIMCAICTLLRKTGNYYYVTILSSIVLLYSVISCRDIRCSAWWYVLRWWVVNDCVQHNMIPPATKILSEIYYQNITGTTAVFAYQSNMKYVK